MWYPKNIFRFIRPVHVHKKQIEWIWKKKDLWKFFFLHFFAINSSSRHEKCCRMSERIFAYFNALETRGELQSVWIPSYLLNPPTNYVCRYENHCQILVSMYFAYQYSRNLPWCLVEQLYWTNDDSTNHEREMFTQQHMSPSLQLGT